jgi:hypothetical protein
MEMCSIKDLISDDVTRITLMLGDPLTKEPWPLEFINMLIAYEKTIGYDYFSDHILAELKGREMLRKRIWSITNVEPYPW